MRLSKRDITGAMKVTGYKGSEEISIRETTTLLRSNVMSLMIMMLCKFKVKKKIGEFTKKNALMKSSGFLIMTKTEHGKNKKSRMSKYGI
jgi:hypothetical protein